MDKIYVEYRDGIYRVVDTRDARLSRLCVLGRA